MAGEADGYVDWLSGRGLSDVDVMVDELRPAVTPGVAWLVIIGSGTVR